MLPITAVDPELVESCHRLNPTVDVEIDIRAVGRSTRVSTAADWKQGTQITTVVSDDGSVRLGELDDPTEGVAFTNGNAAAPAPGFFAFQNERLCIDFFPDPTKFPATFNIRGINLFAGTSWNPARRAGGHKFHGKFRITVTVFDELWRRQQLGSPQDIDSAQFHPEGSYYFIDFETLGLPNLTITPGTIVAQTGPGRDAAGHARTVNPVNSPENIGPQISSFPVFRGFSICIEPVGNQAELAFIGTDNTFFDETLLWRVAAAFLNYLTPNGGRSLGPYNPATAVTPGSDLKSNPDGDLHTGAIPGYGAIKTDNGYWGISRQVLTDQAQHGANPDFQASGPGFIPWSKPIFELHIIAYSGTGSTTNTVDFGGIPTNPVEVLIDDIQNPDLGATINYWLGGSNDQASWTQIYNGDSRNVPELSGANLFRYYRLVAILTGGPAGASLTSVSPVLVDWQMVERVVYSTHRWAADADVETTVDPTDASSSIAELKLPLYRLGRAKYRDLGTILRSNYALSGLEAWVYFVDRIRGRRWLDNIYRAEQTDPSLVSEQFTFLSGMDRLKANIPPKAETFHYPASGQPAIHIKAIAQDINAGDEAWGTNSDNSRLTYRIDLEDSAPPINALSAGGALVYTITGSAQGPVWQVLPNSTDTQQPAMIGVRTFRITITAGDALPAVGDAIVIQSNAFERPEISYLGVDFATVYASLLTTVAETPSRFVGDLPALSGRLGGNTIKNTSTGSDNTGGTAAIDVLQIIAFHLGGALVWKKGRICFVDLYGPKVSVQTFDDRQIVSLETPSGLDKRTPRVTVKYGYNAGGTSGDGSQFQYESAYTDADAFEALGLPNLYDDYPISDDICQWNTPEEAQFLAVRHASAWSTGVRFWTMKTVFANPWLNIGDAITLLTDQVTDRVPRFKVDETTGLVTDTGTGIAGPISVQCVVIGHNIRRNQLKLAVLGLHSITSLDPGVGNVVANSSGVEVPTDLSIELVQKDSGTALRPIVIKATFTAPIVSRYARMEYVISARPKGTTTWTPLGTAAGTHSGPDMVPASYDTDYLVIPYTVNSIGVRMRGIPVTLAGVNNGIASPTYSAAIRSADQVEWLIDYDDATTVVKVFYEEHDTEPPDPLTPIDGINVPFTTLRKGDGQSSIIVPLAVADDWALVTLLAYNSFNDLGTRITLKAQGDATAVDTMPAPGTLSVFPDDDTAPDPLLSWKVIVDMSSLPPVAIRIFRDGLPVSPDHTDWVVDGTGEVIVLTVGGFIVQPGTSSIFQAAQVDAAGRVGPMSNFASTYNGTIVPPQPTPIPWLGDGAGGSGGGVGAPGLSAYTLPDPFISSPQGSVAGGIYIIITPGTNTPTRGVVYTVSSIGVDGSNPTVFLTAVSGVSTLIPLPSDRTVSYIVTCHAGKSGWNDSHESNSLYADPVGA